MWCAGNCTALHSGEEGLKGGREGGRGREEGGRGGREGKGREGGREGREGGREGGGREGERHRERGKGRRKEAKAERMERNSSTALPLSPDPTTSIQAEMDKKVTPLDKWTLTKTPPDTHSTQHTHHSTQAPRVR